MTSTTNGNPVKRNTNALSHTFRISNKDSSQVSKRELKYIHVYFIKAILYLLEKAPQHSLQRPKKVVSNSLGLVDFAIGL